MSEQTFTDYGAFKNFITSRDKTCRYFAKLSPEDRAILKQNASFQFKTLDVAHVYPRSTYPKFVMHPLNAVLLNRYSHSLLDDYKHPITGLPITAQEREGILHFILGDDTWEELTNEVKGKVTDKPEKGKKEPASKIPKGLNSVLAEINKTFSKGSDDVVLYGEAVSNRKIDRIKISSPVLNRILGGGFVLGKMYEFFGYESSGKSLLSTFIAKHIQQLDIPGKDRKGRVAIIDMEHSFDSRFARETIGLDTSQVILSQPYSGEEAINIATILIKSGEVDLVIIDSVAALVPKAVQEKQLGEATMASLARLMSTSCMKLSPLLAEHNCALIFINQVRKDIASYGAPDKPTGGESLKFYASIRLRVKRKEYLQDTTGTPSHIRMVISAVKNKVGIPGIVGEMVFSLTEGHDSFDEYVAVGIQDGFIIQRGAWFDFDGQTLQGKAGVVKYLQDNPDKFQMLQDRMQGIVPTVSDVSPDDYQEATNATQGEVDE